MNPIEQIAQEYPDPTAEDLASPLFEAVWQAIKGWDISRHKDGLYSGPTGNDVMHVLAALQQREQAHEAERQGLIEVLYKAGASIDKLTRELATVSAAHEAQRCLLCANEHSAGKRIYSMMHVGEYKCFECNNWLCHEHALQHFSGGRRTRPLQCEQLDIANEVIAQSEAQVTALVAEKTDLARMLEEAREDVRRLDWLEKHLNALDSFPLEESPIVLTHVDGSRVEACSVRDAITAAMKEAE